MDGSHFVPSRVKASLLPTAFISLLLSPGLKLLGA